MSTEVHVTAILRAREGMADGLITILEELAPASRAEPGCLEYGFYRDIGDPTVVVATETWRDVEAIGAHFASPHFTAAVSRMHEVLEGDPAIYQTRKII